MSFNQRDYQTGKSKGLELAYELYVDHGAEAVKKDIEFRFASKINSANRTSSWDEQSFLIKMATMEFNLIMALNVLLDEFDFKTERCRRLVREWKKEKRRLEKKTIVEWFYEIEETKKKLKMEDYKCDYLFQINPKRKKTDYERGKDDAFRSFLKMLENDDKEAIKEAVKYRNKYNKTKMSDIKGNTDESRRQVENVCFELSILKIYEMIHRLFGFGESRRKRFIDRWNLKAECEAEGYVSKQDLAKVVWRELNVEMIFPYMEMDGYINNEDR